MCVSLELTLSLTLALTGAFRTKSELQLLCFSSTGNNKSILLGGFGLYNSIFILFIYSCRWFYRLLPVDYLKLS